MENDETVRSIVSLDLATFQKPEIRGNREYLWRVAWYFVNVLVFRSSVFGLFSSNVKAFILRMFGAKVGQGLVCKPRVNIKYPWFLTIGDNVWIGEEVWIDNLCNVSIGSNVCLSQGVKILTGSHDWNRPDFPFFCVPVTIGDGVWVTAFRVLRPGAEVPSQVAVLRDIGRRDNPRANDASGDKVL